jgi:hypothetical protein
MFVSASLSRLSYPSLPNLCRNPGSLWLLTQSAITNRGSLLPRRTPAPARNKLEENLCLKDFHEVTT